MPLMARIVIPDVPHHVTHHGNRKAPLAVYDKAVRCGM